MKKKIVSLCLVVALIAIAAVGTLAYFTDTDENQNTFTMGSVDITLDEAVVDRDGDVWVADEEDRVQENEYKDVYPGAVLPKDPTVHNEGTYGAFVRVQVTVVNGMTWLPLYAEDDTLTDDLYNDAFLAMVGKLGEGWELTDGIDAEEAIAKVVASDTDATFVITYKEELAAGADTTAVFETVTIPSDIDQDDPRVVTIQENGFEINVIAEAIQADGFAGYKAAFDAYDGE